MTDTPDHQNGIELAPGVRVDEGILRFRALRSGGPGGQNVNKVSTKVELRLDIDAIPISPAARTRLARLASHLVTSKGELVIAGDEHRSQRRNRESCLGRLRKLIIKAKRPPTPRRPTKPTRASQRRRIETKRQRGQTKQRRQRPSTDD